jgi:hypothetical protein
MCKLLKVRLPSAKTQKETDNDNLGAPSLTTSLRLESVVTNGGSDSTEKFAAAKT